MLQNEDVVLAVVRLVARLLAWVAIHPATANAVRRRTHGLARSHISRDCAAIGLLDHLGVVLAVRSQCQRVRDQTRRKHACDHGLRRWFLLGWFAPG